MLAMERTTSRDTTDAVAGTRSRISQGETKPSGTAGRALSVEMRNRRVICSQGSFTCRRKAVSTVEERRFLLAELRIREFRAFQLVVESLQLLGGAIGFAVRLLLRDLVDLPGDPQDAAKR